MGGIPRQYPLQYGIVPLNLPTDCDGRGNKFISPHALSCPNGGLVLAKHNNADKEWGTLLDRAINSSSISYKPKINSRPVQGERNGAGVRVATGEHKG